MARPGVPRTRCQVVEVVRAAAGAEPSTAWLLEVLPEAAEVPTWLAQLPGDQPWMWALLFPKA